MGLNAASVCYSSATPATSQKVAFEGIDWQGCVALSNRPQSPCSEFSASSSSSSGTFFVSAGVACGASTLFERSHAGNTSSAVSMSSSKKEPSSANFDRSDTLVDPLNIHFPILEEDLAVSIRKLEESNGISRDVNLDLKRCLEDMQPSDGQSEADSFCDNNMFLSGLEKLLDCDSLPEVAEESSLSGMDDLFLDLSCPPDLCMLEELDSCAALGSFRGLEPSSLSNAENMQAVSSLTFGSEEESASQIFAQWLQKNAPWVSLSVLRNTKLKIATVENAIKRLGGGRKGLMTFLKFVLMWMQSSRQNKLVDKSAGCIEPQLPLGVYPPQDFMAITAMGIEDASNRDTCGTAENPKVLLEAAAAAHNPYSGFGSLPTAPVSADSTAPRVQAMQSIAVKPNLFSSTSRGYTSTPDERAYISFLSSDGGAESSQFPTTSFYPPNSQWLSHGSMMGHGMCPSSFQPSRQPLSPGSTNHIGGTCNVDTSSLTLSMRQRQGKVANPAATCRAARKSRMERQRWSVRRSKKLAASNQHQGLATVASSNGYSHTSIASCPPQSVSNGAKKLLHLNPQSPQLTAKYSSTTHNQQSEREEKILKLLFYKELKQSDVSGLGRIVLPKKAAEACLPSLELRDGVNLVVEDMQSGKVWSMRYRFWPNNKSRMYLLDNTSDFVRFNDLKEGDYMMMYSDSKCNKYVLRGVKRGSNTVRSIVRVQC